jgi:two-component system phosphate regulon sensor histidine kinase PhoR
MRWRIASAYIVLIVLTLALLSLTLLQLLRRTYLQTLEAGLAGQARLVATIAESQPANTPSAQRDVLARDLSDQLHGRVTLIAADGSVLADSLLPPAARENLSDRPEVRDALALGSGASERNSAATGDEMFYVAVPFGPVNAPRGIARVGVPLTSIAEAQARLTLTVLVAAVLAALVGLGLSVWIARRTTRPLLELRTMAARLAGGDLAVQVPIPPDEEVAALAQDFNVMASRLRQLLATVETERQRLATVLATMADGILMVGPHEMVTFVNRAAEGMVAVAAEQLPRALTALPLGPTLPPVLRDIRAARAHGTPIVVEEVMAPATGRSLRAVVTPLPTAEDDQALIVLQDLTELRRVEHARHTFLANISHDLRTPLASLQAMIETLQDGALDDPEAARDFLARMDDEVQSLNRLVADFLELSRIESGQLELHLTPTNLSTLLTGVIERMTAQAEQRGVALELAPLDRLPSLTIDGARIEQVLLNLLQNALAFTPRGGAVTLSASVHDDHVALQVRDTGVGIAPEDLPHIFERFYKADRARSGGGTGLGLAIAKHLVERHGGRIWAESVPQHDTTVTFTLPLGLGTLAAER